MRAGQQHTIKENGSKRENLETPQKGDIYFSCSVKLL